MRIQHNIMAMNAYRNYTGNTSALSKNLEKLSSGYKINRAGDDAAGLAISEKMRAQITGLNKAQDNAKDGISLIQTAEGALTEVHDMLNRMYELAEQSANGTYDGTDREQLQKEVDALNSEIDRIANTSNFNGIALLDGTQNTAAVVKGTFGTTELTFGGEAGLKVKMGAKASVSAGTIKVNFKDSGSAEIILGSKAEGSYTAEEIQNAIRNAARADKTGARFTSFTVKGSAVKLAASASTAMASQTLTDVGGKGGLKLQIGADDSADNQLIVNIADCHAAALGIDALKIDSQEEALGALEKISKAINTVSDVRGGLGAAQNRLDHTINNLSVMQENIQDAESTIRDTDVAEEMMSYTKNNILVQSAQAMLAQANQVPQGVLQLLQ